jgi:hypothetical protein
MKSSQKKAIHAIIPRSSIWEYRKRHKLAQIWHQGEHSPTFLLLVHQLKRAVMTDEEGRIKAIQTPPILDLRKVQ